MAALFRDRITVIWLLLVAATLFSWESARGDAGHGPHLTTVAILVIALAKIRFIGLDFMELRHAPTPMRGFLELWLVVVGIALAAIYWLLRA